MRKLLLIGLPYHDYTSAIAAEFEALGFRVTYHEIQPRSLLFKTVRRVLPKLYEKMIRQHHRRIIDAESGTSYHYVVFIQAHQFATDDIEALRRQHAESKFVLYNWDAVTTHDYRPQMHVFNEVFTFDKDDAAELGINYLPLFCTHAFQAMRNVRVDESAVYMVGNIVNPQRYVVVKAFAEYCRINGIPFRTHLACTPYTYYRILMAGIVPRGVSFSYIADDEFREMISRSNAVFDFANHRQAGYTMRVMENLCIGKKLITNNDRIKEDQFYSSDQIHVYAGTDFMGVKDFLEARPAGGDDRFAKYFIQNFVKTLIDWKE